LKEINHEVHVEAMVADFNPDRMDLVDGFDLILDGTDNFQTRYWINDISWKTGTPWIYGACVGSSGIACAFIPEAFPCLRCIFESEPPAGVAPTCDTAGILWPAVGAVVSYQIAAAFKILVGAAQIPQLLQFDVWENQYHLISLDRAKRRDCPACGLHQFPSLERKADFETSLCGRNAVQIRTRERAAPDLDAIAERWKRIGTVFRNPFLVKLILDAHEIVLFPDGRALIQGTGDFTKARDLYAKYVGI
jgi:adenylyltransferase/sulfurtransferase